MFGGNPRPGFQRCLFEEALGDLGGAASADRRNVGDGKKIFHERPRALLVGPFERREHPAVIMAVPVRRSSQNGVERLLLGMATQDAAAPLRGKIERRKQSMDEAGVAEAHRKLQPAGARHSVKRQSEDLGIRGLAIRAPGDDGLSEQHFDIVRTAATREG